MKINIAGRFFPFSHRAGTHVLIPKTQIVAEIYPSFIRFHNCESPTIYELDIQTEGYIDGFTIIQDLEKHLIRVFGTSSNGYISYELQYSQGYIILHLTRAKNPLNLIFQGKSETVLPKGKLELVSVTKYVDLALPRLAFGVHKLQNIDHIAMRRDLREIIPFLYRIGKLSPTDLRDIKPGTTHELVQKIRDRIEGRDKIGLTLALREFFCIAIRDLFVPQLFDYRLQGSFTPPNPSKLYYDTNLLSQTAGLIETLFLEERGDSLFFLPLLLPTLHAGRFVNLSTQAKRYTLDMEWRSHKLRKVIFYSYETYEYHLILPKPLRTFRMKSSKKDPGIVVHSGDLISVKKDSNYFFDRFQI